MPSFIHFPTRGQTSYELLTKEKAFNEKASQQIIELLNSGYPPDFTSPIEDSYKILIEEC